MKILKYGLFFLSLSTSAFANSDISIEIQGTPVVVLEDGIKKLQFDVTFQNLGTRLEATVSSKALLFPLTDYSARSNVSGIVLPTFTHELALESGESQSFQESLVLPNIPESDYLLGAITDTKRVLAEDLASYRNNVTEALVSVGRVSNEVALAAFDPATDFDFRYERSLNHPAVYRDGSISHISLLIGRGPLQSIRNGYGLTQIFVAADIANSKLYFVPYFRRQIDQPLVPAWNRETDALGNPIMVDYEGDLATVDFLSAGTYVLGSIINIRDTFVEAYPENNLTLNAFTLP